MVMTAPAAFVASPCTPKPMLYAAFGGGTRLIVKLVVNAPLASVVTVTVAAGMLQQAGLIRSSRGVVTVLDRPGLEAASCECYRLIQTRFDRLLG